MGRKRIWCAIHKKWHSQRAAHVCATEGREIRQ